MAPSSSSQQKRWNVSLPPPRVSNPIHKKVPKRGVMNQPYGVPPYFCRLQEGHMNVFDCLLTFYTPKIWVWWNNSRKMPYCPCMSQGRGADKQRTPLCYRSGLLHPAIFSEEAQQHKQDLCVWLSCLSGFWVAANCLIGHSEEGESKQPPSGVSLVERIF